MNHKTRTHTIIPALPGWGVTIFVEEDGSLSTDPIVAWDIERIETVISSNENSVYHIMRPLTADGNMDTLSNEWVVKRPDGRFEDTFGEYPDEDALIKEMRQRIDKRKKSA